MVDIHHHLLYGLDDGSKSLDDSIAMAKLAVDDGMTHVVCTPHANYEYPYDPAAIAERLSVLREALATEGIPLQLGVGCDFHISYDNLEALRADPRRFSINGGRYLLIELPDALIPQGMSEISYNLQLLGLTPILTHPERNPILQREPDRLNDWLSGGMLVQVTADSVTGSMGRTAEKIARTLLDRRWVHFLASDAHSPRHRAPRMRAAAEFVARHYGEEYASQITDVNPRAVFDDVALDLPMPYWEDEVFAKPLPWWRRLLRSQAATR